MEEGTGDYVGEGCSTEDLAPKQAPALQETVPTVPEFWAMGPSVHVAGWEPPASSRAKGKVPAMQVVLMPPAEMDEEIVCKHQ